MNGKKNKLFLLVLCSCMAFFISVAGNIHEADAQGADYTSPDMWKGKGLGKGVYMMNCVPCHGDEGKGDGPLAYDFPDDGKPRNHTDSKYMSARSDAQLLKAVTEGGESVGRSSGMPAFKGQLSDKDIKEVVTYLRELCKCSYKGK